MKTHVVDEKDLQHERSHPDCRLTESSRNRSSLSFDYDDKFHRIKWAHCADEVLVLFCRWEHEYETWKYAILTKLLWQIRVSYWWFSSRSFKRRQKTDLTNFPHYQSTRSAQSKEHTYIFRMMTILTNLELGQMTSRFTKEIINGILSDTVGSDVSAFIIIWH